MGRKGERLTVHIERLTGEVERLESDLVAARHLLEDKRREELLAERKCLDDAIGQSYQQFDKSTLTMSAGALAFSLTFIKDLAPQPSTGSVVLLGIAWLGYIGSICTTMASFLYSIKATHRSIEIIHCELRGDENIDETNKYLGITDGLNWTSLVAFILSTILTVSFALANVGKEGAIMSDLESRYTELQEGKVPLQRPPEAKHEERGRVPIQRPPAQTQQSQTPKTDSKK